MRISLAFLVVLISSPALILSSDGTGRAGWTTVLPYLDHTARVPEVGAEDGNAGSWSTGAAIIPTARYYAGSVAYTRNDTTWIYVFGGDTTGGGVPTRTCSRYNVRTNTWSLIAPLPEALRLMATARLGDRLYSIGGLGGPTSSPVPRVYEYNVLTNTWTQRASLPVGVFFGKAVGVEDSLIYVAGGVPGTSSARSEVVRLFNANLNAWRDATPMQEPRSDGGFAEFGGKLIYFGGFESDTIVLPDVEEGTIDPQDKAQINWTIATTYPLGTIARLNAHEWGSGKIIVGGGSTTPGFAPVSNFYEYDVMSRSFQQIPSMPNVRSAYQSGSTPPYKPQSSTISIRKLVVSGGVTAGPALSSATHVFTDTVGTTIVQGVGGALPETFTLHQNHPNPFNPGTTIGFRVRDPGAVLLTVYDVLGRTVATLADGHYPAGNYEAMWDATGAASGVYFYRLQSGDFVQTRRMMLAK
jgi:hypothetical protein